MKGGRCTPQSLESAFYLFAGFAFLNLLCNFIFILCTLCFLFFSSALLLGDFLKTFSDCCLGMSKVLHQKQYGSAEGDGRQ